MTYVETLFLVLQRDPVSDDRTVPPFLMPGIITLIYMYCSCNITSNNDFTIF